MNHNTPKKIQKKKKNHDLLLLLEKHINLNIFFMFRYKLVLTHYICKIQITVIPIDNNSIFTYRLFLLLLGCDSNY